MTLTDYFANNAQLQKEWSSDRNTVSTDDLTAYCRRKVWWRCERGHEWQAIVFSRTKKKGAGCPYCTGRKIQPGFNDLASQMPGLAEQWYQPLNGELTPEDVTLGSNKKVWWQCKNGHVWQAYIYARTKAKGTGCPVCAGKVKPRRSSMETPAMTKEGKPS